MVAQTASLYDPSIVVTAAFMTAAVVTGLSIHAWKTERDYSILGSVVYMIGFGMVMFALFAFIF